MTRAQQVLDQVSRCLYPSRRVRIWSRSRDLSRTRNRQRLSRHRIRRSRPTRVRLKIRSLA